MSKVTEEREAELICPRCGHPYWEANPECVECGADVPHVEFFDTVEGVR